MKEIGKYRLSQLVVAVCVVMQIVAFMPHHHHGSHEACIDSGHLFSLVSCGGSCAGHAGEEHPTATCDGIGAILSVPDHREGPPAAQDLVLRDCHCRHCLFDIPASLYDPCGDDDSSPGESSPAAIVRRYLAAARGCRASDHILIA